jgi:hypothetical protein
MGLSGLGLLFAFDGFDVGWGNPVEKIGQKRFCDEAAIGRWARAAVKISCFLE